MVNFALLIICLLMGVVLRRLNRLPAETPAVLNSFIFHISFPALVLGQVHHLGFSLEWIEAASMIWMMLILSVLLFVGLNRLFRWKNKTLGALILTSGLGNTSFVGFPMIEALLGISALNIAIVLDQLGSFLILSSLGIGIAATYSGRSGQSLTLKRVLIRILSFPPTYALILGLLLKPVSIPDWILEVLAKLGSTLTPLALVSTGFQLTLSLKLLRQYRAPLLLGLTYKLLLGPLVLMFLYFHFFHLSAEVARVMVLEAAMAPMITAAIVSAEYDLDTELANLMVGIGIPLSFLTIPLWTWVLS